MERTKLRDRVLPNYSFGEECANTFTHIFGGALGVVIAVFAILLSASARDAYKITASAIYGFTVIALYAVSSVYHGLRRSTAKKVMQVIDHCTIYFFIAGTYTPILLAAIRPVNPVAAWVVFGIEWGCTFAAAALTAIDLKKYSAFSFACYILMGWCIILILKTTVSAITAGGFMWLLAGGIAYTLGAVLYGIGAKKEYYHTAFHVFVDIGTVLHAVCILKYVL